MVLTRFALLLWYPSASQPSAGESGTEKKSMRDGPHVSQTAQLAPGPLPQSAHHTALAPRAHTIPSSGACPRQNADLGPPTITGCCSAVDGFQIVRFAKHSIVEQRELLAGGQLAAARVARKARQMEDQLAGASHPVRGGDAAAAFRAFCTKVSEIGAPRVGEG